MRLLLYCGQRTGLRVDVADGGLQPVVPFAVEQTTNGNPVPPTAMVTSAPWATVVFGRLSWRKYPELRDELLKSARLNVWTPPAIGLRYSPIKSRPERNGNREISI
jgi:hypothetical protein